MLPRRILLGLMLLWIPALRAAAEDLPAPQPESTYVLQEYVAAGAAGENLLEVKMTVRFTTLTDAWTTIPLFPVADASLSEYRVRDGDRRKVHLRRTEDRYELLAGQADDYSLELTVVMAIHRALEGQTVNLPFLPAVKALYRITVPEQDIDVSTQPQVNLGRVDARGGTEIFVYGGAADRVALTWRPRAGAAEVQRLVFADQTAIMQVHRGSLRLETKVHYTILQGRVAAWELQCPTGMNLLGVEGEGVRDWEFLDQGDHQLLRVALLSEVTDSFDLTLHLEQNLPAFPVAVELPTVVPLGVERDRGHIGVAPARGIQAEVASQEGTVQVDLQDLPAGTFAKGSDVHLIFRYLRRPFRLSVQLGEVTPKVSADVVTQATVGKDAVRLQTEIRYTVRDAGVFQFRVRMDEGLKLVDLQGKEINNWRVRDGVLEVDLRAKVMGEYVLTLRTERFHEDRKEIAVPVIEVLDVEGERGYVGWIATAGSRVETVRAEGLSQVNANVFPTIPQPKSEPKHVIEAAYRYLRHPYELVVSATDVEPEIDCRVEVLYRIRPRDLEVDAMLTFVIRKAGVFSLRVALPPDLRVSDLTAPSLDDWKRDPETGMVTLSLPSSTQGEFAVHLRAERTLDPGLKDLVLPRLAAPGVRQERGHLAVVTDPAIRVRTVADSLERIVEADLRDLPEPFRARIGEEPALAFKYFEPDWKAALTLEQIEPRVMADTFQLLSLGEDLLHAAVGIHYRILHAGVSRFRVRLPKDALHVEIEGANIKSRQEETTEEGVVWTVVLHAPAQDAYELFLTFQRELKGMEGRLDYSGPAVLDVDRETGYLTVAARPEVEIGEPHLEDLTPIDDSEIPATYRQGITAPLLHSFRYLRPGYALGLPLLKHDGTDVLVAVVEACRLSTVVSEEGHIITDMVCRVRNRSQQYLELILPEGATVWHASVRDRRVTPLAGKGQDGQAVTLIPIAHSGSGEEVVDVRLRWALELGKLGGFGRLDLETPPMKVPVLRLGWAVSLPDGYELAGMGGNMRRIGYFEQGIDHLAPESVAGTAAAAPQEQDWGDTQALFNSRVLEASQRGGRAGGAQGPAGTGAIYTGAKPGSGMEYRFQTLVPLGEPGRLLLRYVRHSVGVTSKGLLFLLFVFLPLAAWRRLPYSAAEKIGGMICLSLVLLGFQTLLERNFEDYLAVPTWTLTTVALLLLVWTGFDHLRKWWSRRPPRLVVVPSAPEETERSEEPEPRLDG